MFNPTLKAKYFPIVIIGVLSLIELLVSFQGFDLCDEGWTLSGYQQFARNPESVQYQFLYYNSLVIGAAWNAVFGGLGIIGFRLLDSVFIILTGLVVYAILKEIVNRWLILAGLVACVLMREWGSMIFNHNSISAFLVVSAVYFMLRSFKSDKTFYLFLSFFIIGVNVFSRLPNLTMFALGIALLVDYAYKKDPKLLFRQVAAAFLGSLSGIAFILFYLKLSGNLQHFSIALQDMRSAGSDPESTHQLPMMLKVYFANYKTVFKHLLVEAALIGLFVVSQLKIRNSIFRYAFFAFFMFCFVYLLLRWKSPITWSYSIVTMILLFSLVQFRRQYLITQLIVIALIVANFLPLGSDFGIDNMGYASLYIAWPLSIGLLGVIISNTNAPYTRSLQQFALVLMGAFFLRQAVAISQYCYFDEGSRFNKRYAVNNRLANTFTTKEKAAIMDELLLHLSRYVKKDDYLLCFQSLPMVNYVTETRPYLNNSWVWTYDPSLMSAKFVEAEKNIKELPVIVREKCQPLSGKWTTPLPSYNREDLPTTYEYKGSKIKLINNFISVNAYKVAWENNLFQILVPPHL
ncbi:glycosyltransferase family 39 protein [Filimonas effusa]|uniref:Uncharacterized protein n=1 Tax=Filimonas effusa TaxID=2508721 RepID=A0A4Q1D817_9BACT|nr:glycosyltransferase family 39 protein [Filimonas effusa]RXK85330.1 hypothetical protein ESB13_00445 [Filimonas effusa]